MSDASYDADTDTPEEYIAVLHLLQEADCSGRWPATSRARAKVLRVDDPLTGGSFSLRAPDVADPPTWRGRGTRGNLQFPELASAIFDLERTIAPGRPPSAMVAVNRRALFLPHTSPGAGVGESLIVGLGAYTGGELAVEGEDDRDIRYAPLSFDGWHQCHWTRPFEGERFSLVWFTPEDTTEGKKPYGATLDPRFMKGKVRFSIEGYDPETSHVAKQEEK